MHIISPVATVSIRPNGEVHGIPAGSGVLIRCLRNPDSALFRVTAWLVTDLTSDFKGNDTVTFYQNFSRLLRS
jgi:hypothetical protein